MCRGFQNDLLIIKDSFLPWQSYRKVGNREGQCDTDDHYKFMPAKIKYNIMLRLNNKKKILIYKLCTGIEVNDDD